ncbi:MAG: MlaE family lipid ABC transporter permease subunit [Opitutales bacterium]|nr:MlaE family lipid ABC transporter permease subunit [Opitutales bacterium]
MESNRHAAFEIQHEPNERSTIQLRGDWLLRSERPTARQMLQELMASDTHTNWAFDCCDLGAWDSALMMTLARVYQAGRDAGHSIDTSGLPDAVQELLELSQAVPEAAVEEPVKSNAGLNEKVGVWTLDTLAGISRYTHFMGQLILDVGSVLRGRTPFRFREFWILIQQAGVQALPIVALLSFLTGLIIAFIGIIQLQKFAADIYVADLVGLVMTRELAAVMTGVIMAGRTGAAYAAQIGSMRVNEEVDALKTFGIEPVAFLALPRVLALVLMMPLLTILSNVISIAGGMVVSVSISSLTFSTYINETIRAVALTDVFVGVFKSLFFGVIIAFAGCYRGLHCGKDAAAVGRATTSAVVTAITWIVIVDAVFAVIFHILGI